MKKISLFVLLFCFAELANAQDTIVRNDGAILPGYILPSDSNLLSYKDIDSSINEIHVVNNKNILLIKHNNGRIENYFKNDTITTMQGEKIACKVLEISSTLITFLPLGPSIKEPLTVPVSNVFLIKYPSGKREMIHQEKAAPPIDYHTLGTTDAHLYYNNNAVRVGEALSGLALQILPAAIIYACPAKKLDNPENPNNKLLQSNLEYYTGYQKAATKIKRKKAAFNFGAGVATTTLVILLGVEGIL